MRYISIVSVLAFLAVGPHSGAQPGLLPQLRGAVYRVEQPGLYEGTAVMFVEKSYNFLITNLHVVRNDSGQVCDSLFLQRLQERRAATGHLNSFADFVQIF